MIRQTPDAEENLAMQVYNHDGTPDHVAKTPSYMIRNIICLEHLNAKLNYEHPFEVLFQLPSALSLPFSGSK